MIWLSVLLSFFLVSIDAHRILGIISIPSYSHQIVFQPLWRELSLRGHEVTVLTSNPMKDPSLTNLTEIDTSFLYEGKKGFNTNLLQSLNRFQIHHFITKIGFKLADLQLQHPPVQAIIQNTTEHFDIVIAELHYQLMFAFAERFKCPLIAVSSLDANPRIYNAIGNPHHPLLNKEIFSPTDDHSTFYERFLNAIHKIYSKHLFNFIYAEEQDKIIEKHFGKGYPSIVDLEKKPNMVFINTDFIFHTIHPLLPSVISIGGGIHVKPSKPLPKDLQTQCDNAKSGFVYFSLGSNVKSQFLPDGTIRLILDAFAEIPYTIFWKFEVEGLLDRPSNVIINKWFPQQSLLEHPNIKLFITQGGLQSLHEAILNEVPLLGIPFIGDQVKNIDKIVLKEMGLVMDLKTMTKESFKRTIMETIENPKYRRNVEKYARILKDEPMSGLEKAVWWTEYVIRHKGAKHFRSYGAEIPSYQYFLLDVIGFCLVVIGVVITILVLSLKLLFRIFKKILMFKKPKRE